MSGTIRAWRPAVTGVSEVFHAHFPDHTYPMHTHDTWTLLLIDEGTVQFELDHHEHGALRSHVTLLPPHVPHDGRSATPHGFRKRVLYLDTDLLDPDLTGRAVDQPALPDPLLRHRIHQLHHTLAHPGEQLAAQSRLTLVVDRLTHHLLRTTPSPVRDPGLAKDLRDLLDANVHSGLSLTTAATLLGAHPTHLVRSFSREYGIPPHQYLTGRRVDLARRLLLSGLPPAEVAARAGFYDQSHLSRHFKRLVGTSPGRYALMPDRPGSPGRPA
ncbi:AraC family transcriptional regulator [Saccharothrix variisporea]|uniref:AraC family transcriptional regulator n=1 Tax=Saccharothrix variisporea TaxID=543527 RepID=A0A495XLR5_9PSEU|nr:AraC family transcriptional regulator [Saccharothrix variisporea]RKT74145.1 AraC family transcriptional regulator [Saccharothrix variisporea]